MKSKFMFKHLVALLLLGIALEAWGGNYPTDGELTSLPPYCKVRLRMQYAEPEYQSMLASYGPDFQHVHHHCAALNFMSRYYRTSNLHDKKAHLREALGNFDYMVSHAKPEFILMPDVYMNRAITYSLMKHPANAINDLQKAISLNPKLARAHLLLADYQVELKQAEKALDAVTEGLRHMPDSKSLQRRYVELGGKLPYPEPYQKTEEQKAVAEIKEPGKEITPPDAPLVEHAQPSEPAPEEKPNDVEPPTIGMPGNPWCRFCPDTVDQKADRPPARP